MLKFDLKKRNTNSNSCENEAGDWRKRNAEEVNPFKASRQQHEDNSQQQHERRSADKLCSPETLYSPNTMCISRGRTVVLT